MPVFSIDSYRVAEPAFVDGDRFFKEFIEELKTTPTQKKFDQLVERYPDFNIATGWLALLLAIREKSLPFICRVLDLRPDLLNKGYHDDLGKGATPLSLVADDEDTEFALRAINELLARGADVNLADRRGVTSLFQQALSADRIAITRALLERGAVIYQAAREALPNSVEDSTMRRYVAATVKQQPANIAAALEGVSQFARGQLYANPTHPMNRLPLVLCKEIASFVVPTSYLGEQTR